MFESDLFYDLLFDMNSDGKLDISEEALRFMVFEEIFKEDDEEEKDEDDLY